MLQKILVANRGEIACRVMRSARKMGIKTVAVYSDADRDALHVEMADEAVHIGAAPAAESYLVIDKILDAIRQTGADAVHPGYGFLSERADFAEALASAGVVFIGPPAGAIKAMGDKIESKKLASEAGVSTVPGYLGVIESAERAVEIAEEIGYPVMLKASAGGGGKGMRVAYTADEVKEGFTASMNEARNAFGDDRVFVEKFVEEPRHIEIQVLGDTHGEVIYLGERECSIQRRNQKVVEEAPSPFLDEATRRMMGEQSVALAKAVDYCSAGTVEFIVDKNRNFYFLEMNTRLQVEHPVTELITGVDLVEQMIRVAAGEKLGFGQSDVALNGWAIENRLYAEDPYRNFLPSIGRLRRYRPPTEGENGKGAQVRNDGGVREGSEISLYYDPMIAKLCTWAPDRAAAIDAQARALDQFEIEGVGHNAPFLSAVMAHPRFRSGDISTAFIKEEFPDGFAGVAPSADALQMLARVAAGASLTMEARNGRISGRLRASDPELTGERVVFLEGYGVDRAEIAFDVAEADPQSGRFVFGPGAGPDGGRDMTLDWRPGDGVARASFSGAEMVVKIDPETVGWRLRWRGVSVTAAPLRPEAATLARLMPVKEAADSSKQLLCPMPGLVVRIDVSVGDEVQEGQTLAVVEAMKMENILRAERAAKVKSVLVSPGESLAVDAVMIEFE